MTSHKLTIELKGTNGNDFAICSTLIIKPHRIVIPNTTNDINGTVCSKVA